MTRYFRISPFLSRMRILFLIMLFCAAFFNLTVICDGNGAAPSDISAFMKELSQQTKNIGNLISDCLIEEKNFEPLLPVCEKVGSTQLAPSSESPKKPHLLKRVSKTKKSNKKSLNEVAGCAKKHICRVCKNHVGQKTELFEESHENSEEDQEEVANSVYCLEDFANPEKSDDLFKHIGIPIPETLASSPTFPDTNITVKLPVGIAFDIDGVLKLQGSSLPGAKESLEKVKRLDIPFLFVTNGGGKFEEEKLQEIVKDVGVDLKHQSVTDPKIVSAIGEYGKSIGEVSAEKSHADPLQIEPVERIQLSHTPMKQLASKYGDKFVFAVGSGKYVEVLRSYGFKYVATSYEYIDVYPGIYSHFKPIEKINGDKVIKKDMTDMIRERAAVQMIKRIRSIHSKQLSFFEDPKNKCKDEFLNVVGDADMAELDDDIIRRCFPAELAPKPDVVFIIHDPVDWHLDMTLLLDLLYSDAYEKPVPENVQVPVYVSQVDVPVAMQYPHPLIGPGTFCIALEALVRNIHGRQLNLKKFGKPFKRAIKSGEKTLKGIAVKMITDKVRKNYVELLRKKFGISDEVDKKIISFIFGLQKYLTSHMDVIFENIYMIGDNPASDIRGAIIAGYPWKGVLVQTGIWKPTSGVENDPDFPADFVVHSVSDAIDLITKN